MKMSIANARTSLKRESNFRTTPDKRLVEYFSAAEARELDPEKRAGTARSHVRQTSRRVLEVALGVAMGVSLGY